MKRFSEDVGPHGISGAVFEVNFMRVVFILHEVVLLTYTYVTVGYLSQNQKTV